MGTNKALLLERSLSTEVSGNYSPSLADCRPFARQPAAVQGVSGNAECSPPSFMQCSGLALMATQPPLLGDVACLGQKPAVVPALSQPGLAWRERSLRKRFPKREGPEVKGTRHSTQAHPRGPRCGRLSLGSAHDEKLPDVLEPSPVLMEINPA